MTFRRNYRTRIEGRIIVAVMILMCLGLLLFSLYKGEAEILLFLILMSIASILTIIIGYSCFNDYITIDENGISCKRKSELIWSFKWDEIAQIKKCNVNRHRGVALITYNKRGEPECSFENGGHDFELCKKAKQALQNYGKTIEK